MSTIHIKELSKSFGTKKVLDRFSEEIPIDGTTVIMGESGCGKTTLINIMMGFEHPDSGEITGMPTRISAVFQDDCLCEDFSALSNIRAITAKKYTDDILSGYLLGMGLKQKDITKPVHELSGGMKRRVAIARSLAAESDLIIMDEPFKGIDEDTREKVIEFVLNDTKSKGKGLLVITHDASEISLLNAQKTILMRQVTLSDKVEPT